MTFKSTSSTFIYKEKNGNYSKWNSNWPHGLRITGSVIPRVFWKVVFFAIYTTVVVLIQYFIQPKSLGIPQTLITILGLVTSLLLVFRTNTAYDRYWEGRRLWSQQTLAIRNLARFIWVGANERTPEDKELKKKAIDLLIAFAVSVKHYLREEYQTDYDDIIDYISHIPKYANQNSIQPFEKTLKEGLKRKNIPISQLNKPVPTNIPLEISYHIQGYIIDQRAKDNIDISLYGSMNLALTSLIDCLTGYERILRTPIPLAYSIHLSQVVWMYLLALPFQLISAIPGYWGTIGLVSISALTMFGIESIGEEIENPFGYDENDLPLDLFCKNLKLEIESILKNKLTNSESWILLTTAKLENGTLTANPNSNSLKHEERRSLDLVELAVPINVELNSDD